MSNHSVIEHRANYHFFKMEEDYVQICQGGKQYPQCKAAILGILEHWINDKKAKGQDEYVYMTYPEWIDAMYGLFRRTTIIACLTELEDEQFILRRSVRRHGKDTYEYTLNTKVVQERLKQLSERTEKNTRPNLNASKFKRVQKQTDVNLDGSTDTNLNGSEHENPSKNGRNIDSITETPSNIDSESSTGSGEPAAPASLTAFAERKKATDEHKAITQEMLAAKVIAPKITLPSKQKTAALADGEAVMQPPKGQAPGQPDVAPPASVGASTAQAGAGQDVPPLALTPRQIKQQNERRAKDIWAIIERERQTKYSRTQRELYDNSKGIECIIADDIDDETLIKALKAMDPYQRRNFTVSKFYGWIPNLTANESPPSPNGKPKEPEDPNIGVSGLPKLHVRRPRYA